MSRLSHEAVLHEWVMPFFLGSGFLVAAAAVIVPIALHLLQRRRPRPVMFGTLRFLRDAIAQSRRAHRITQGLTLLMRILIILLLAAAFARPLLRRSGLIPAGRRTVVMIVDCSASMQTLEGGRNYFDHARSWAVALTDSLQDGDRAAVVAAGLAEPRVIFPPVSDVKAVRGALQELSCGQGAAPLAETIQDIFAKGADSLQNAEIHVFSDFQTTGWSKAVAEGLAKELKTYGANVFFNRVGLKEANDAGLQSVRFYPSAVLDDGHLQAECDVTAGGSYLGTDAVKLFVGEEEKAQATVMMSPAETEKAILTTTVQNDAAADVAGRLELDADAFDLNNCFYFSLPRFAGLSALLVNGSGDGRESSYLRHALNPGGVSSALMVPKETDWAGFASMGDLAEYAVVFVCNPPPLEDSAARLLLNYVKGGGVAVIFPGGNEPGRINSEALAKLEAWPDLKIRYFELGDGKNLEAVVEDANDRLAQRLAAAMPPPWSFLARRVLRFQTNSAGGGVLQFRDGGSMLLRKKLGEGELWLCGVSANRDWADWPLHPMFFIFVQEISRQAAGLRQRSLMTQAGEPLKLHWPGSDLRKSFTVTEPDGASRMVEAVRDASGQPFQLDGFDRSGLYRLADGGGAVRMIAVNVPSSEMVLSYWSGDDLQRTLPGVATAYTESHDELRRELLGMRQSHPLWPWLLLAAFVLSMVEVVFANVRSRPVAKPHLVGDLLRHGGGVV